MQVIKEVALGVLALALCYPVLFMRWNEKYVRRLLALCLVADAEYFVYRFHPHGSWSFGYYAVAALLPFGLTVIAHVVFEMKDDEERFEALRIGYGGQL
jgi:hypothetical protein